MQTKAGAPLISAPETDDRTNTQARPRRPLFVGLLVVTALIYLPDQLTKQWAVNNLTLGEPRDLIGSSLRLTLTRNSGAAFSVGTGATWVFTLIALAVVAVLLVASRKLGSRGWAVALGLLLGGCLGNLTDRMIRPPGPFRGHVVDFLQLPHWPIFNVADSAVVSAAVLIALLAIRGIGLDGAQAGHHHAKHHDTAKHDTAKHDTAKHDTAKHDAAAQHSRERSARAAHDD